MERDLPIQSIEEINKIIQDARIPGEGSKGVGQAVAGAGPSDSDEIDMDSEVDISGDFA